MTLRATFQTLFRLLIPVRSQICRRYQISVSHHLVLGSLPIFVSFKHYVPTLHVIFIDIVYEL